jgi:hypothetical protein
MGRAEGLAGTGRGRGTAQNMKGAKSFRRPPQPPHRVFRGPALPRSASSTAHSTPNREKGLLFCSRGWGERLSRCFGDARVREHRVPNNPPYLRLLRPPTPFPDAPSPAGRVPVNLATCVYTG